MMINLGTNRIESASTVIEIGDVPLFDFDAQRANLKRFELRSPPANQRILVTNNEVVDGNVRLVTSVKELTVESDGVSLVRFRIVEEGNTTVDLDLRPVGLSIYTDKAALHIGRSIISGNTFRVSGAAIRVPPPKP